MIKIQFKDGRGLVLLGRWKNNKYPVPSLSTVLFYVNICGQHQGFTSIFLPEKCQLSSLSVKMEMKSQSWALCQGYITNDTKLGVNFSYIRNTKH